jgi:hypothetical protein
MHTEPWLDKRGLAQHYACSVRMVEYAHAHGMPHRRIFGRPKYRVSIVEPWLEQHGYIERADGIAATVDAGTGMGPHRSHGRPPTPKE